VETTRIQNGQTERIEVIALDVSGDAVNSLTNVLLGIRRISDDQWLDFNDNTFKVSGWSSRQTVMTEFDATYDSGKYKYTFNSSGFSDDTYQFRSECVSASNFPQLGEVKVGDYVDNLDALISASVNITNSAADLLLTRPLSHSESIASNNRCLHRAIVLAGTNKIYIDSNNVLHATKSNDTDDLFTATVSTANVNPIVALDP
jgi:hypothetical protein